MKKSVLHQTDANGVEIDKFAWQGGKFKLGRLSYGSISMSTSLRSKPKDAKKEAERKKRTEQQLNDPNLIGDQQRLLDYMQQNPSEFVDFNVPKTTNCIKIPFSLVSILLILFMWYSVDIMLYLDSYKIGITNISPSR